MRCLKESLEYKEIVLLLSAAKMKMKEKALKSNYSTSCSGSPVLALTGPLLEISASISQLEAQFRAHIEVLVTETDSEERCSAIEHLVQVRLIQLNFIALFSHLLKNGRQLIIALVLAIFVT